MTLKEAYSQVIVCEQKRNYRNGCTLDDGPIVCCFPVFCKHCEAWHVFSKAIQFDGFPMHEEIRCAAFAMMQYDFRTTAFKDAEHHEEVYFKRKRIEHHAKQSLFADSPVHLMRR